MLINFYIVPAWSDQASQCRIVSRTTTVPVDARKDYLENSELWHEAGLMNSRGELVYLSANKDQYDDIKGCVPLMAGCQFTYEVDNDA